MCKDSFLHSYTLVWHQFPHSLIKRWLLLISFSSKFYPTHLPNLRMKTTNKYLDHDPDFGKDLCKSCVLIQKLSPTCFNPSVPGKSSPPPSPRPPPFQTDSTLPPSFFHLYGSCPSPQMFLFPFPVRPKWEGHLPRETDGGLPLRERVGKVNRGRREKSDDRKEQPVKKNYFPEFDFTGVGRP